MKKNLLPKMWMTALMAATAFAGVGTPVLAAAGTNYGTTIEGTKTTTFDKFLVMDKQANVPNATFTYAVTAGNAKAYDVAGKKFQVLAGVDSDKITMAGVLGQLMPQQILLCLNRETALMEHMKEKTSM